MTAQPAPQPGTKPSPSRSPRVWAFALYAGALAIATHWPGVTIEGPIDRPDLVIHLVAFSIWTILLATSRLLGDPRRPVTLPAIALVASAYAALDEFTQRYVSRTSSWDDYLANLAGIGTGVAAMLIFQRIHRRALAHSRAKPGEP